MSDGCSGETRMLEKKVGVVIRVYTLGGEYCIFFTPDRIEGYRMACTISSHSFTMCLTLLIILFR